MEDAVATPKLDFPSGEPELIAPKRIDKTVQQYRELDAKIDEIKKLQQQQLRPFTEMLDKLEGRLLQWLEQTGQQSARTAFGTIAVRVNYSAKIKDFDAFMTYVINNDAFELLDRHANKTACKEFAEEHGSAPPGVQLTTYNDLSVRKPT